jgi:LysM repeat protein
MTALKNTKKIQIIVFTVLLLTVGIIIISKIATNKAMAEESAPSYKYYTSITIQEGDSLWSIAGDYITDQYKDRNAYMKEVMDLNHISNPSQVHAGEHLTIPYYSSDLK